APAHADRDRGGDALAVGEPGPRGVGSRGDRGEPEEAALHLRQRPEERRGGRGDAGAGGTDGPEAALAGAASWSRSLGGHGDDSLSRRAGRGSNPAREHGPRAGEVVRGPAAGLL